VYQCAASAPVAIDKRMDSLEGSVGDRGLGDWWKVIAPAETAQIVHQARHARRRRWDELGLERPERVAADPILLGTELAAVHREASWGQEPAVHFQDAFERHGAIGGDCIGHGVDVGKHFMRELVGRRVADAGRSVDAEEAAWADFESFYF
jgi:hypothetical protein